MEAEQTQSFNQKLSQWIASQGFWFQLRHSISGGGGWAMTMNHLLRLGFKVFIALVVAAGGFGVILVKRVGSPSFVEGLTTGIKEGLGAADAKVLEFSRTQGDAQIRRIGAEGGKGSFFHTLDAGNVRFKMGMMAGLTGTWEAGNLSAKWMDINVRAGAETPAEAKEAGAALFKDWKEFSFSSIEVDEATVRWGYSGRTAGKIEKSRMKATPSGDIWHLEFTGGTFSQNWLKGMEITSLVVDCTPTGLKFVKGEFKAGGGTVKFVDVQAVGGDKPVLSGKVELSKVELTSLMPESVHPFVEGVISGEFKLSGSTNSRDGVQLEGDVVLGGGNLVSLRDKFHLLERLGSLDIYHNYRKLDLNRGTFHLKSGGGAVVLSRVDVRAEDLVRVKPVRPTASNPTPEEVEPKIDLLITLQGMLKATIPEDTAEDAPVGGGVFAVDPKQASGGDAKNKKDVLTLDKAGAATKEEQREGAIFSRFAASTTGRVLEDQKLKQGSQSIRYEGGFTISLLPDAFDSAEALRQGFPVNPSNNRIGLDVPIQGTIYEITRRQADELQELSEKR
ncbi:hypothetical protein [Luteolibacter sp. Populi]|uniref:hypothetical protein n=1 Tax=Luteolibacter sp. Populi TaxID=3230487 RepID=UPI003466E180